MRPSSPSRESHELIWLVLPTIHNLFLFFDLFFTFNHSARPTPDPFSMPPEPPIAEKEPSETETKSKWSLPGIIGELRQRHENANTVTLPMDPGVHLTKSQSPAAENEQRRHWRTYLIACSSDR